MKENMVSQENEAVSDSQTHPKPSVIRAMFDEYKVPINFRRHCEAVAKASVILANKLVEAGADVDVEFTESLALVHDLFKHVTVPELKVDPRFDAPAPTKEELEMHAHLREKYQGLKETNIASGLFKDQYPKFAESIMNEGYAEEAKTWEEKIVGYIDYITFSDRIIGLEPRLQDIEGRYHADEPEKDHVWQKEKAIKRDIERQIFTLIDITPEELTGLVNNG